MRGPKDIMKSLTSNFHHNELGDYNQWVHHKIYDNAGSCPSPEGFENQVQKNHTGIAHI
jgi:hypothetical protein